MGKLVDQARAIRAAMDKAGSVMTDEQALEMSELYRPWAGCETVESGNIRRFEGKLYRCVLTHTTQSNWIPPLVANLWTPIGNPADEWPEWSQPIGAHDAYAKGAKVSYNGKHWVSDVDGNVWQPGAYGWTQT